MTGHRLAQYRKEKKRTQVETARALGVSQTYLSLLETGKRPLTDRLQKKAARFFELPPTEMPARLASGDLRTVTDEQLASDLADLGYTGFSHLKRVRARRKNPADVLLRALNSRKRDARLVEALPWVVLEFPNMDWKSLVMAAKAYDLQNRLGFITDVARQVADLRNDRETSARLGRWKFLLEHSKLEREDTLCNETMTNAERNWLQTRRPDVAQHWHMLTSLSPNYLNYAG
jgi:transcriptional regulator with XRE-family HTH domain